MFQFFGYYLSCLQTVKVFFNAFCNWLQWQIADCAFCAGKCSKFYDIGYWNKCIVWIDHMQQQFANSSHMHLSWAFSFCANWLESVCNLSLQILFFWVLLGLIQLSISCFTVQLSIRWQYQLKMVLGDNYLWS